AQEILLETATPLSLAFHEAAVAAVFQQFGFIVFAPESRRLLAIEQSRRTHIPSTLLLDWLDQAAYQQLADFHVLRYLESEPDWLILNQEFCTAVVQRIVVCRPTEWTAIGLEHYPSELLNLLLRVVDMQMLAMRQGIEVLPSSDVLREILSEHSVWREVVSQSYEKWGQTIDAVLHRVSLDPLLLLAWRLEAFSTERQLAKDASLAVKTCSPADVERRALSIIALVVLLAGFEFGEDKPVVSETPVTFTALCRTVSGFVFGGSQNARAVAELLGCHDRTVPALAELIETNLAIGEQLGVFQWTGVAKGQRGVSC
ncbi:hypothetical protein EBR21_04980, partial [bacterium]|nr:hypothetical protein [bacterium]